MNAPHADGPEIPRSDIEDKTAVRAYERWVARGRPNGTQLQDWIEAEVEVRRLKDLAQRSREADTPLCDSIAESGRGENELWISGEVGHGLFDSVPDAIVVVRRDGRLVAVNAQAQVIFGYKREEMLGRPVEMLLPRRFQDRRVASRDGYFSGSAGGATRSYGWTCYDWSYDEDVTRCASTGTLPGRVTGVIRRWEALGTT